MNDNSSLHLLRCFICDAVGGNADREQEVIFWWRSSLANSHYGDEFLSFIPIDPPGKPKFYGMPKIVVRKEVREIDQKTQPLFAVRSCLCVVVTSSNLSYFMWH